MDVDRAHAIDKPDRLTGTLLPAAWCCLPFSAVTYAVLCFQLASARFRASMHDLTGFEAPHPKRSTAIGNRGGERCAARDS